MARPSYDISGSQVQVQKDYPIAAATVIKQDSFVKLTAGLVVQAAVGETGAILGTAAEAHTGVADAFNVRSNGTVIRINCSPSQIWDSTAPQAVATSGSATTFAATTLAAFANSDFVVGYLKLISKVAASTNTDPVGTVYPVTGSTAATKLFTFAAAGGAITVGDVMAIFPPIGFAKGNLDATFSKYDLTATAALAVKTADIDLARNLVLVEATLHQNSNKQS